MHVKAIDLLCPERFDLIAKIKYVENYERNLDLPFIKDYYLKTIEAFTEGSYHEDNKKCGKDYIRAFNELIESVKERGIDENISMIKVNQGVIVGCAHRTAIAIYYNLSVPVEHGIERAIFDYAYFREKLLDERVMDWTAVEYCKLKKNTYLACIWPRANYEEKYNTIMQYFNESSKIIYEKKIEVTRMGFVYLIAQVYSHQEWVGNEKNHYQGAAVKAEKCWNDRGRILTVLFESDSLEQVLMIKRKIRDLFDIGNHSIHITDNQDETKAIAGIVYNENSLNFLNAGAPDRYPRDAARRKKYICCIEKNNLNKEDFIVDSSGTLSLYGLREANDLDYLYLNDVKEVLTGNDDISCHEECMKYHKVGKNELILNPENYFIYDGIKFITLKRLRKFKKNRGEEKDILDCRLIDSFLSEHKNMKYKIIKLRAAYCRKIRNVKYCIWVNMIHIVKKILIRLGIFEFVKQKLISANLFRSWIR